MFIITLIINYFLLIVSTV